MNYSQLFCPLWQQLSLLRLLLVGFVCVGTINAAPGRIDLGFYPIIDGSGTIHTIATQPDGKILVGGIISKANGEEQSGIVRLNQNGSVDLSFSPVTMTDGTFPGIVKDIKVLSDGKILIAGTFVIVSGQARNRIARLNSNGSLDTSFLNGLNGASGTINSIAVQADGKIIIGGDFFTFNNVQRNGFARLNPDGNLDSSFFDSSPSLVNSVAVQPDGKILIGGRFGFVASTERRKIARFNSDGTLDTSFLNGLSGANDDITSIRLQQDGKILISGAFTSFNSMTRNRIARLNPDGSLDTSFLNNLSGADNLVNAITQQPDGKILVGGFFTAVNGSNQNKISRLNIDGTLDSTFVNSITESSAYINAIAVQTDGKILIGGWFNFISQVLRQGIARLNYDGTPDTSLAFVQLGQPGTIRNIARQSDGRILVSGQFRYVNGIYTENLGRVNSDGSLDSTFSVGSLFSSHEEVNTIVPLPNGKILIGGIFDIFLQTTSYRNIARLNSDGSVDTTFTASNLSGNIESISLQPDGKIIVGGSFNYFNNVPRNNLVRLNADGTVDTTFLNNLQGTNSFVLSTVVQPDGKIVIGGSFSQINGVTRDTIARLNNDGSLDTTFQTVVFTGGSRILRDIKLQSDGKLIIGGIFSTVNGVSRNNIARLNSNGTLDTSFLNNLSGTNGEVTEFAINPNGRIIIGGRFTSVNGIPRKLARLNNDGSLDESFNFNLSPSDAVTYALLVEPNGNLLVGGFFNKVNGLTRASLFRVIQTSQLYDFDGDGRADISVFRPSNAAWYLLNSSNNSFAGTQFGISTDKLAPADFDGDGRTDVSVFRDGFWYRLNSSDNQFVGVKWGQTGDIPVPADYDGDSKADLAVFRSGNWYILQSSNNQFRAVQFGISTDRPVQADYDGDGKTDVAVFRDGNWYWLQSTDNAFRGVQFGMAGDIAVVGDYDGDSKADQAVFRNGFWYLNRSKDGFTGLQFGLSTDIPAPADYDGDGKTDIAVYREGNWYRLNSSNNQFVGVQFGVSSDKAVPSAFIP